MTGRLQSALSLGPRDWVGLAHAWLVLLLVSLGLRVLSFTRVREGIGRRSRGRRRAGGDPRRAIQRERRLLGMAARRRLPPTRCLERALALQWLLAGRGIRSALRIGVSRGDGDLAAHAWLEHDGRPIAEPGDLEERYLPLAAGEGGR